MRPMVRPSASGPLPRRGENAFGGLSNTGSSNRTLPTAERLADSIDRLTQVDADRKKQIAQATREETLKVQQRRNVERLNLTQINLESQVDYSKKMASLREHHRSKSAQLLQNSPFLKVEPKRASVRNTSDVHLQQLSNEKEFAESMNYSFALRSSAGDEFEELVAERRRLAQEARRLWTVVLSEKAKEKKVHADERRRNRDDAAAAKRRQRDADTVLKQEFFRSLSGWDGTKSERRKKPLKELWLEFQATQ